jgi:hypothetical protein
MIGKFNDINYDGLVIKMPSFFIDMNGLQPIMDELYNKLKDCEYSKYLPEHLNNLYELENIKTKKEIINNKKAKELEIAKLKEERQNKILSGEIYELEWLKKNEQLNQDYVIMPDGEIIKDNEYMTNKMNVKSSFIKKVMPTITTFEKLKEFSKRNFTMLNYTMENILPEFIRLNVNFYTTNHYGALGISYERLYVKTDYSKTDKYLRWRQYPLVILKDGCLGIDKGGNIEQAIRLDSYIMKGLTLIKE